MSNNIGIIGSKVLTNYIFEIETDGKKQVSKIFVQNDEHTNIDMMQFPFAELVYDITDIINDHRIDTVLVSENKLEFAGDVLKAGKSVRVI